MKTSLTPTYDKTGHVTPASPRRPPRRYPRGLRATQNDSLARIARFGRRRSLLAAAGCTSSTAVCPCPAGGIALFPVPAAATNPIVSVSADPPCTADGQRRRRRLPLPPGHGGICRGRAVLTNGDTYEFSVEFRPSGTGCCGTLAYPIDASPPVLVDGGQD